MTNFSAAIKILATTVAATALIATRSNVSTSITESAPSSGKATRHLKGSRKLQVFATRSPLFTGGIIEGDSAANGASTSSSNVSQTKGAIAGTTGTFDVTSGINAGITTRGGSTEGSTNVLAGGNTASSVAGTGITTPFLVSTQDAAVSSNAAADFNGGFSPANVLGNTVFVETAPNGSTTTTPVVLVQPTGATGGTASSSGQFATTATLTQPLNMMLAQVIFVIGAAADGISEADSSITSSNQLGLTSTDTIGDTSGGSSTAIMMTVQGTAATNADAAADGSFGNSGSAIFGGPASPFSAISMSPFSVIPGN